MDDSNTTRKAAQYVVKPGKALGLRFDWHHTLESRLLAFSVLHNSWLTKHQSPIFSLKRLFIKEVSFHIVGAWKVKACLASVTNTRQLSLEDKWGEGAFFCRVSGMFRTIRFFSTTLYKGTVESLYSHDSL